MSKTITFFKEIARIPRESGNEANIAEYLCEFARERNLEYQKDKYNNVLIKKRTIDKEPLILQAHTDMVCVSNRDFDFQKEGIEVIEKDGYLQANGTTLGADNGIGVAQILNILDSDIPVNIEAVFTTSEETTMVGAQNFDIKQLKGKYLLNLDGFDEDMIICASAAYYDLVMDKDKDMMKSSYSHSYKVKLGGLPGGHSGYDLDKNRGNAIIMLAEFLQSINAEIVSFNGGTKNNVFPTQAEAVINIEDDARIKLKDAFINKYQDAFPNLALSIEKIQSHDTAMMNSNKYLEFIINFPSKGLGYNEQHEVTTSLNLGAINDIHLEIGMRSSIKEEALEALEMLKNYGKDYGFNLNVIGYQPGFYSDKSSLLIQNLIAVCPYQEKALAKSLHITVEAGFFQEKRPDLDIAIIAPDIKDAHSINERVSIKSIEMTDKWLEEFLTKFYGES